MEKPNQGEGREQLPKPRIGGTPEVRGKYGVETPLASGKYSTDAISAIRKVIESDESYRDLKLEIEPDQPAGDPELRVTIWSLGYNRLDDFWEKVNKELAGGKR